MDILRRGGAATMFPHAALAERVIATAGARTKGLGGVANEEEIGERPPRFVRPRGLEFGPR